MSLVSKGLAIQAEYADKRKRALNKRDQLKIDLTKATILRLAEENHIPVDAQATRDLPGWEVIYRKIITNLQNSTLTINLAAETWFGGENKYETYATTYQKHVAKAGDKNVLKTQYKADGSESEKANARLYADEKVTLPAGWKDASRLHPQRRRIYKAMSTTGGKNWDALTEVDVGDGKVGYQIDNRHFNPNSKQVFAALNYGRRANGASYAYGHSYIALKSELKRKAIYFPGDTFGVAVAANAVDRQCTFETLGGVLANAHPDLAAAIWKTCYGNLNCASTDSANELLEAHIFQEVRMNQHVESLHLSRSTKNGDMSAAVWAEVMKNARLWCTTNNVRLVLLSAW